MSVTAPVIKTMTPSATTGLGTCTGALADLGLANVAGLYVLLRDPVSQQKYVSGVTDGNGNWSISNLPSGITFLVFYGVHPSQGPWMVVPGLDSAGNAVAGESPQLTLVAQNPPSLKNFGLYNVKTDYGAKLDGVTDDTTAWQNTLNAGPGIKVIHPGGVSIISAPLNPTTKTVIEGIGRGSSIIKGAASFPSAANTGLISYNAVGVSLYQYVAVRGMGFDATLTNQASQRVNCIHQSLANPSAMQHCIFEDLAFELGTGNSAMMLEGLGATTTHSFDITARDFYSHNGAGDVVLYMNSSDSGGTLRQVFIQNIQDLVDINGLNDDRVVIGGPALNRSTASEIRDIEIDGVMCHMVSGLTTGSVNAVKLDTGQNCYLHQVFMRSISLWNLSGTTMSIVNSPIDHLLGTAGYLQDVYVDGVFGYQTGRCQFRVVRKDAIPVLSVRNVRCYQSVDTVAGLEVYTAGAAQGDEVLILEGILLKNQASQGANIPVGIMLTSGSGTQGWSGQLVIRDSTINTFKVGISNNINEAGSIAASGWNNLLVDNVLIGGVSVYFNLIGNFITHNSPSMGAPPAVTTPSIVTTLVTNQTGNDCLVYMTTGGTNNVPQVNINGNNTGQTVPISTTAKLVGIVPALGTIQLVGATLAGTSWLWVGLK